MLSTVIKHGIAEYALNMLFGGIFNNFISAQKHNESFSALIIGNNYREVMFCIKLTGFADKQVRYLAMILLDVHVHGIGADGSADLSYRAQYLGKTYDSIGQLTMDCMFDSISSPKWVQLQLPINQFTSHFDPNKYTLIFASTDV